MPGSSLAGELQRGGCQHEPGDAARVAMGQQERDRASHRVADRHRPGDAEGGEECGRVVGAVLETQRCVGAQASAVAAIVERDHAVVRESRIHGEEVHVGRCTPTMQQKHRRSPTPGVAHEQLAATRDREAPAERQWWWDRPSARGEIESPAEAAQAVRFVSHRRAGGNEARCGERADDAHHRCSTHGSLCHDPVGRTASGHDCPPPCRLPGVSPVRCVGGRAQGPNRLDHRFPRRSRTDRKTWTQIGSGRTVRVAAAA